MFDMEKNMPKALEGFGMSKTGKIAHDMKDWLETTVFNNNRSHVRLKLFKRQLLNKTNVTGRDPTVHPSDGRLWLYPCRI